MKKVSFVLAIVLIVSGLSLASCAERAPQIDASELSAEYSRDYEGTVIKVYNWGEYISTNADGFDVNKAFKEITGVTVDYVTYDDNETMYAQLDAGATYYDIIVPSDYMIERLIREDKLEKIDTASLSNYKNIDEKYKGLYFDPDEEYSVPYNVGMVGLIYNTSMVEKAPTSWTAMWDKQYAGDVLMFDNPRDAFAIAQFILGYDLNTTDKSEWDAAAELLAQQNKEGILQSYVMDQVFNKMEGANAAMAPYYAGDYLSMYENNPDLAFVYPEEGVNIFVDSVCIPKGCQNYDAALMYINFLMEPAVALANAETICYASPNKAVVENDEYTYKGNEILYPSEENMPKTQWFHDMDADTVNYYEQLWVKVKNS